MTIGEFITVLFIIGFSALLGGLCVSFHYESKR